MCKIFERRKQILESLIRRKRHFYLSEIEAAYAARTGGLRNIDGFETVKRFIANLEESGYLRRESDRYHVVA